VDGTREHPYLDRPSVCSYVRAEQLAGVLCKQPNGAVEAARQDTVHVRAVADAGHRHCVRNRNGTERYGQVRIRFLAYCLMPWLTADFVGAQQSHPDVVVAHTSVHGSACTSESWQGGLSLVTSKAIRQATWRECTPQGY